MENFISERNYANDLQNVSATRDNHFFKELYKRYWTPLIHYSSQYLDDRATCEEIVQELFIQLHLKRDEIKIRTSLSSYLYTALRNRIFNYFRDQAVYRRHISTASRSAA